MSKLNFISIPSELATVDAKESTPRPSGPWRRKVELPTRLALEPYWVFWANHLHT